MKKDDECQALPLPPKYLEAIQTNMESGKNIIFRLLLVTVIMLISFIGFNAINPNFFGWNLKNDSRECWVNFIKGDYIGAFNHCMASAELGDATAQNILGWMYANGEGVTKDAELAVAWYHKAAKQGVGEAQYKLSWMYAKGEGAPKNYIQAYKWIILSVKNSKGIERTVSILFRDRLAKKLTDAQIAESERLAAIWKAD